MEILLKKPASLWTKFMAKRNVEKPQEKQEFSTGDKSYNFTPAVPYKETHRFPKTIITINLLLKV